MGPLSRRANTAAIIAGKASGQLTCLCPGQLERESFDNDNAAEGGWERHMEGDIFHSLYSWGTKRLQSGLDFTRLLAFKKHRFDLWPRHHMLFQFAPQWSRRRERWEWHCHIGGGLLGRQKSPFLKVLIAFLHEKAQPQGGMLCRIHHGLEAETINMKTAAKSLLTDEQQSVPILLLN